MKSILHFAKLVVLASFVLLTAVACNGKSTIKPLEEVPAEEILAFRGCPLTIENGVATMMPIGRKSDSGLEILGNYDLTEYKCARFTVENIDPAPLTLHVTFSHDKTTYFRGSSSRRMSVGHLYFIQPGEKREIELAFPRSLEHPDVEAHPFFAPMTTSKVLRRHRCNDVMDVVDVLCQW